jgi:hypothetical protein
MAVVPRGQSDDRDNGRSSLIALLFHNLSRDPWKNAGKVRAGAAAFWNLVRSKHLLIK